MRRPRRLHIGFRNAETQVVEPKTLCGVEAVVPNPSRFNPNAEPCKTCLKIAKKRGFNVWRWRYDFILGWHIEKYRFTMILKEIKVVRLDDKAA